MRDLFGGLEKITYPPYNIRKSENAYVIQLAVAGFLRKELTVEVSRGTLTVTGSKETKETGEFIWKGISSRSFTRKFTLGDEMEVDSAELQDGILSIFLVNSESDTTKVDIL